MSGDPFGLGRTPHRSAVRPRVRRALRVDLDASESAALERVRAVMARARGRRVTLSDAIRACICAVDPRGGLDPWDLRAVLDAAEAERLADSE